MNDIKNSSKFLKTGISGFDELLGDGILRNSTVTLSGPTGSGKSTFGLQFLVEGSVKYNEPGLYISLEDSKETLLVHMAGYGWDLKRLEMRKQLFILDFPVYELDQFLNKKNAVGELIKTMNIERVVVDSIMPIALSFKDQDERKREFIKLIDNFRNWGTTTLITSDDLSNDINEVIPRTAYEIEKLSDGWIHIDYYVRNGIRKRTIEVIKMKGSKHVMKKFFLDLTDNGFEVVKRK